MKLATEQSLTPKLMLMERHILKLELNHIKRELTLIEPMKDTILIIMKMILRIIWMALIVKE